MIEGMNVLHAILRDICRDSSDETIFKGATPVFKGAALGNTNSTSTQINNGFSIPSPKNEV